MNRDLGIGIHQSRYGEVAGSWIHEKNRGLSMFIIKPYSESSILYDRCEYGVFYHNTCNVYLPEEGQVESNGDEDALYGHDESNLYLILKRRI